MQKNAAKKQNHEDVLRGRVAVHIRKQVSSYSSVTSFLRLSWPSWPGLSLLAWCSSPPSGQNSIPIEAPTRLMMKNDDMMTVLGGSG
jgi:hypothetical protein